MTQRIGEVAQVGEGAVTSGDEVRGTGAGTVLTGLIGMDIQSSRSPEMHMREAAAQGIKLRYELFDLAGEDRAGTDLAATLDAVERAGFAGVNITHPFKQSVIALLDRLSDEARAIGA